MKKAIVRNRCKITHVECFEGETIEEKVRRVVDNKEPITDGAPMIYTDSRNGVVSAYDIRTDKWDVALMAMDAVARANIAKGRSNATEIDQQNEESITTGDPKGNESTTSQKTMA